MTKARVRPTRAETMERLMENAPQVFAERGFHGARIEDICLQAGLTRGAFYSSFDSKDALFLALYDRMAKAFLAQMAMILADVHFSADPIASLGQRLSTDYPLDRNWYLLNSEFTLYAIRNPKAAKRLAEHRAALRSGIGERLENLLHLDGRQLAVDRDLVARTLVAIADGNLSQHLVEPGAVGRATFLETMLVPIIGAASVRATVPPSRQPTPLLQEVNSVADSEEVASIPRGTPTPARIIDAAARSLYRHGYGGTSISVIVEEAGTSRGALLHHFPTKTDIMVSVVRRAWELDERYARAWLAAHPDPKQRLIQAAEGVWRCFRRPTGIATLEILMACRSDPELRAAVLPIQNQVQAAARYFLGVEVGAAVGLTAEESDAFARFIGGALRGLAVDWMTFRDPASVSATLENLRARAAALIEAHA